MPIENQKYKDTVFRMLFNNKIHLLELYNAMNNTHYTNPDDLTITTLSGETFLKMKNDLSFLIEFELNIFEHQSTPCPNIPLRDLYYLSANLKDLIPNEKLYGPTIVNIPAPRFFVFYNGITSMEDKVTYRLSDMFAKKVESPSVELTVTALNINNGHSKELMEACKALKGYSIFVDKVRKYKLPQSTIASERIYSGNSSPNTERRSSKWAYMNTLMNDICRLFRMRAIIMAIVQALTMASTAALIMATPAE